MATATVNPANVYKYIPTSLYANRCHSCLHEISKGEPILYRPSDRKVHHTACPLAPVEASELLPSVTPTANKPIPDGTYTVVANGKSLTFRIKTQDSDATFAPDKRIISTLIGSDNESDYLGWGFVSDNGRIFTFKKTQAQAANWYPVAIALITGDWQSAGIEYAKQSGNCYRCGRKLTVVSSIDAGLGPICAQRIHG